MDKTIRYPKGASLPDLPLIWRDRSGVLLPLLGITLVCKIGHANAAADKTITTVTGADTAPNVLVQFGTNDLNLAEGNWMLQVEGTIGGKVRKHTWPLIIEGAVN